jgi:hypothetical protein
MNALLKKKLNKRITNCPDKESIKKEDTLQNLRIQEMDKFGMTMLVTNTLCKKI